MLNDLNWGLSPKHPNWKEPPVQVKNYTLLQGLLRSGVTVADAIDKYKLKVNRSKRHSNLVQFKYDQIESNLADPLVQQCRGIILDEADNWEIIARPFDKFFNHGEVNAAEIDWTTAKVVEKLDGSCCFLYYYQGWHVATLGSPDASGDVHGIPGMTFKQLFWDTFTAKQYKVPDQMWQGVTFIFELMTPYNRVVVPHVMNDLKLIGARLTTGEESAIVGSGYELARLHHLKTLPDIQATFAKIDPLKAEGYVVVDGNYNRIKVKHPGYVRIHHIKDSFTLRNVVDMVRKGDSLEFLTYFPEHLKVVNMVREAYFDLIDRVIEAWLPIYQIPSRKDFAEKAKLYPFSGVLFALYNGHAESVKEALQKMYIDTLIEMLEVER